MRTRGAMPCAWGIDPAHVVGSTTSSPIVSCDRKLRTTSGEAGDEDGFAGSDIDFKYRPAVMQRAARVRNGAFVLRGCHRSSIHGHA